MRGLRPLGAALLLFVVACVAEDLTGSRCDGTGHCGGEYICRLDGTCARECESGTELCGGRCVQPGACNPKPEVDGGGKSALRVGEACSSGEECLSGNCGAGGRCGCALALNCARCTQPCDSAGTACVPVDAGAVDPTGQCVESLASCQTAVCNADGTCRRADAGTVCSPRECVNAGCEGQCASSGVREAQTCRASGPCPAASVTPCENEYVCDPAARACRTGCRFTADCVRDFFCLGGSCVLKQANTASCTAREQCTSNVCTTSGNCQSCETSQDCPLDLPVCQNQQCVACTPTQSYTCGGLGDECNGAAKCVASGAVSCSDPRVRSDQLLGEQCGCQASGVICRLGTRCVGGVCKAAANEVCFSASECQSNVCDGGHCGP